MSNPYIIELKGGLVDVYDILQGYEIKSHAVGHAIKKLLVAGKRPGGKSYQQDLGEAIRSIQRAIVQDEQINGTPDKPTLQ